MCRFVKNDLKEEKPTMHNFVYLVLCCGCIIVVWKLEVKASSTKVQSMKLWTQKLRYTSKRIIKFNFVLWKFSNSSISRINVYLVEKFKMISYLVMKYNLFGENVFVIYYITSFWLACFLESQWLYDNSNALLLSSVWHKNDKLRSCYWLSKQYASS